MRHRFRLWTAGVPLALGALALVFPLSFSNASASPEELADPNPSEEKRS